MELEAEASRVLACLIEKQLITPQQYPLTMNALVAACNQTTSRWPVVAYGEATVESALDDLKAYGLVRFDLPSHGRSANRYRQIVDEALGLGQLSRALLAVLVLRGPQTASQLRARVERMAAPASTKEIEGELGALERHSEGLARRVNRQAGHKEARYVEMLTAPGEMAPPPSEDAGRSEDETMTGGDDEPLEELRREMARLSSAVEQIRVGLDELRRNLGG